MKAATARNPKKYQRKRASPTKTVHFLIVEDDPVPAELVRRGLLAYPCPYRLTVATTLAGARAVLESDLPDLVILDLHLPDGKGDELLPDDLHKIRFPVIAMIDAGGEAVAPALLQRGIMDYLVKTKPAFDGLPARVALVLKNWKMHTSHRVLRHRLSTQEALVRAMMENPADSLALLDRDGMVLDLNNTLASRMGRPRPAVIGTCVYDYFPENLGRSRREQVAGVFATGTVARFEDEDGGRYYDNIVQPVKNGDSRILQAVVISRDVTDKKTADLALKKSEEQYRYLVENMMEAVWITTPDMKFTYNNRAAEQQTGYSPEELAGRPLTDILTPATAEIVKDRFQMWKTKLGRNGSLSASMEIEFRRKDGSTGQAEVNVTTLLDPEGRLAGFQGIARDITGRKRAEASLRESEERYRMLVEELPDFVIVHRNGELLYANAAITRLLGTTAENMLHTNILNYFPKESQEIIRSAMGKRAVGDPVMPYVVKIAAPGGGPQCWVEIRGARIMFEGQPAIINVLTDITAKKWAEEALYASEQKFRTLADYTFDWEYWIGPDGELVYVSPSCERITGYTPGEFYRDRELFSGIVLPEERELLREHYSGAVDSADPETLEFRIRTKDGAIVWIGHLCRPIYGPGGEYLGRRGSNRDITQRKLAEDALRESETKFRELVSYIPLGVGIVTLDGHLLTYNDAMCHILGIDPDRIPGSETSVSYVDPQERRRLFALLEQEHEIRDQSVAMKRQDGTVFDANLTLVRFEFNGQPVALVMLEDVSEKNKAKHALIESETRFRALIQNASDMIRILDRDGKILYESPSSEKIHGYPPGALLGKDAGEYIHPEDRDREEKDFQALLDGRNTGLPTEFRIRRRDGTYIWVDSQAANLIGVPGVDGIVVTTRPIEQRKKMEHALRESEARYRVLFDLSPVGIVLTDPAGNILEMNQSMLEIFGYTRDAIGSVNMATLYGDAETRSQVVADVLARGSIRDYELTLRRSDCSTFPAILNSSRITQGEKQLFQTSVLDITDRKMMEEEIRSLNRALEQRVIQRTNELNASLGEKEVLLREIHHRVKNNLQIIISILRLQNRHTEDPGTQTILRDSESRVRSMALVHEKLYRSVDLAHIDIGDYLRDLSRYLFNTYSVNPSQVVLRSEITGISLDINRAIPIGLILNELISNALKHAYPDGRRGVVLITGREDGDTIVLSLHDDGIGMPPGFDWRHSSSLGMHLVMTLIEQARGTIECPDCACGTHFVLRLPRDAGTATR